LFVLDIFGEFLNLFAQKFIPELVLIGTQLRIGLLIVVSLLLRVGF
jgi:hypothetical protein